jgi:FdhE protein
MGKQLQRLRQLRERMPDYHEVLELAEKILVEKHRAKTEGSFPPFHLDPIKAKIQMEEGFPYVRPGEIPLDLGHTQEYFNGLLGILREQNSERYEALEKTSKANGFVFDQFLKRLLENQLMENRFGEDWGIEGRLLFFFLVQSLKPTFEFHAESWRRLQKEISFPHGFCPFCAGLPGMGEIRAEGRRVLHCPLCATGWDFPRMRCPYCQNEDQEKLTYFEVEGEAGYRVDICLHCQYYIKTIDTREKEGPLDWEVEDYLTLYLDHLAQEEGYKHPEGLFVDMIL